MKMEAPCPYDDCDGWVETEKQFFCLEEDLRCPKCERKVGVEHECYMPPEYDCIEWLLKEDD